MCIYTYILNNMVLVYGARCAARAALPTPPGSLSRQTREHIHFSVFGVVKQMVPVYPLLMFLDAKFWVCLEIAMLKENDSGISTFNKSWVLHYS